MKPSQLPPVELGGLYIAAGYGLRYVWVVDGTPGSMRSTSLNHRHARKAERGVPLWVGMASGVLRRSLFKLLNNGAVVHSSTD